jgi:1-acyl-sn-glycerol-3-phosphate acyltransferase
MVPSIPADARTREPRASMTTTPERPPSYRVPWHVVWDLARSAVVGQPRSFTRDAQVAVRALQSPPEVLGAEEIPASGAFLVVCNHYTREGLGAWWIALSVAAAIGDRRTQDVPSDVHWVTTAAWRYPLGNWRRRIVTPATRWAFARVAQVYDFVTMPPMPPDPDEVEARALAARRTVQLARRLVDEGGILGLVPEGRDTPGLLGDPPAGAGSFIALLVQTGMPVLPTGLVELDGHLRLSFGPLFVPEIPQRRADRDRAVINQVLDAIAAQLVTGP